MKIITSYTFKGGVGKTTTSINLASGLAFLGNEVLIIDLDPQSNTTSYYLGDYQGETLADCLFNPESVNNIICETRYEKIDILPASMQLIITNDELTVSKGWKQVKLYNMLKHIEKKFDYCIIDCPPHYSELVVNALYVTDDVIIPFRSDANSLQAFEIVRKTIDGFNDEFSRNIKYKGLFTGKDYTNIDKHLYEELLEAGLIYDTAIRYQANPVKKSFRDKTILDIKSGIAQDYENFIHEYVGGKK